jgi:aryl-alcohol dehydrogenase-like predicted oxidoreductase
MNVRHLAHLQPYVSSLTHHIVARRHGLTPFSLYQGRWNAAYRDMEAEIIPMCEDQGLAIVSWASLGGGQLASASEREAAANDPKSGKGFYNASESDIAVSKVLERLAEKKHVTLQQMALAYLFHQSTHVFPIVGVQTVEHVRAMVPAMSISLSKDEIGEIQGAAPFNPLFPQNFIFGGKHYSTRLTAADQANYQMAAWIDAPPKNPGYAPRS